MGTKRSGSDLLSAGGRVLMVLGSGKTLAEAHDSAYRSVAQIDCPELFNRQDIGSREI